MIVTASHDLSVRRRDDGPDRNLSRGHWRSRLLHGLFHQFVVHFRMLNYPAMKSLRGLLLALLLFPLPGWAQGVRMSADFLPLEVGRSWTYDVTNETGQKVGQIGFEVEEYTIVSGAS